jgi:hypothetical protein
MAMTSGVVSAGPVAFVELVAEHLGVQADGPGQLLLGTPDGPPAGRGRLGEGLRVPHRTSMVEPGCATHPSWR